MNSFDWRNATPEQINLWRYASSLIAYTTITRLYFLGAIAGSEYLTYNAGKLYIALECGPVDNILPVDSYIAVYNQANVVSSWLSETRPYWDVTAAAVRYVNNPCIVKNIYFSRIDNVGYTQFLFNGYRLNV